jgi:ankyrin repeat protein
MRNHPCNHITGKVFLLSFVILILFQGMLKSQSATDSTTPDTMSIDTSGYIGGDIHFNLLIAAFNGYNSEVLRLLNKGAFADYRSAEGITALMYAVENGYLETARILLVNGAYPDLKDHDSNSPLITAVKYGDLEMAELLIRKNAGINIRGRNDRTPLMIASLYGFPLVADMLLYYDADVNLSDASGNTALHIASYYGYTDIVKLLASKKAVLEKADDAGFTPLHSAAQNGHTDIVKFLIEQGAGTELRTNSGHTPLSLAILNHQKAVVEFLIGYGSDVNSRIARGIKPLDMAQELKNDSIISLLKSGHATPNPWPAFHYTSVNFDFNLSANDFFLGGGLGFHDIKYNLSVGLGYNIRIGARAILVSENNSTFYQYWERRSFWYLNAEKLFRLVQMDDNSSMGVSAGGQLVYTYGNYRGSSAQAEQGFRLSPQLGFYYRTQGIEFSLYYEYLNFNIEKVSPNRFKFKISFLIADTYLKKNTKKELWSD